MTDQTPITALIEAIETSYDEADCFIEGTLLFAGFSALPSLRRFPQIEAENAALKADLEYVHTGALQTHIAELNEDIVALMAERDTLRTELASRTESRDFWKQIVKDDVARLNRPIPEEPHGN